MNIIMIHHHTKEETLFNNKPNMARMINNICSFDNRSDNNC